ncbi:hypothetical protein NQZ68_022782 [Dissostichus eleginoides]|nr:hypothetical protein NQZ68_022782 [Dissostichus eleginoides]
MSLTDKHKVKRQRLDRICEGKIISSPLPGSPRGLLSCWALLEPAQGEADMTAVLENDARRTISLSASIFVLQHDVSTSPLCS